METEHFSAKPENKFSGSDKKNFQKSNKIFHRIIDFKASAAGIQRLFRSLHEKNILFKVSGIMIKIKEKCRTTLLNIFYLDKIFFNLLFVKMLQFAF